MTSVAANRMELFVRKSFQKSMRTREKNDAYEHRLRHSLDELQNKHEIRTKHLNNEIRQLAVNLRKAGVKDVSATVSLPSTAPSSRTSTPDPARSTATSLPSALTSLPQLHDKYRHSALSSASYKKRADNRSTAFSRSTASTRRTTMTKAFSSRSAPLLTSTTGSATYGSVSTSRSPVRTSSLRKSAKRSSSSRVSFASQPTPCLVDTSVKSECQHFPCLLPSTCSQFGYRSGRMAYMDDDDPDDGEVTTRAISMPASAQRRLFRALDATSARRPLRSNMQNKCKLREDGLNKQVNHMRWKNDQTKPPEWILNYGKPTPLRKVLKPARATALAS